MTVGDFAKAASAGDVLITVCDAEKAPFAQFKAKFWECVTEEVLSLEVESLSIDALFGIRASVSIIVSATDEDDPEPDPDVSEDEE